MMILFRTRQRGLFVPPLTLLVIRKRLPDESLKIATKRAQKNTVGVIIKTKTL